MNSFRSPLFDLFSQSAGLNKTGRSLSATHTRRSRTCIRVFAAQGSNAGRRLAPQSQVRHFVLRVKTTVLHWLQAASRSCRLERAQRANLTLPFNSKLESIGTIFWSQ